MTKWSKKITNKSIQNGYEKKYNIDVSLNNMYKIRQSRSNNIYIYI